MKLISIRTKQRLISAVFLPWLTIVNGLRSWPHPHNCVHAYVQLLFEGGYYFFCWAPCAVTIQGWLATNWGAASIRINTYPASTCYIAVLNKDSSSSWQNYWYNWLVAISDVYVSCFVPLCAPGCPTCRLGVQDQGFIWEEGGGALTPLWKLAAPPPPTSRVATISYPCNIWLTYMYKMEGNQWILLTGFSPSRCSEATRNGRETYIHYKVFLGEHTPRPPILISS